MTNPGDALGTNGAFGGRTSVNALNDVLAAFDGPGILQGWKCVPKAGLTVSLGGDGISRDVAVVEDDIGNRTTVDNRSEKPVDLTLSAAPNIGQRIDVIVAYVNNPPEGDSNKTIDNPGAVGLISVQGEVVTNNPIAPTETEIRTAIGADGGDSAMAYYVVLATVAIAEGATDIVADDITAGKKISIGATDEMLDPNSQNPVANSVLTAEFQKVNDSIGDVNEALIKLDTGTGVTL